MKNSLNTIDDAFRESLTYDEYVEWEARYHKNMAILELQDRLIDMGCAVVIFNSEDLRGVDPLTVENAMIERGWDVIEFNQAVEQFEEKSEDE